MSPRPPEPGGPDGRPTADNTPEPDANSPAGYVDDLSGLGMPPQYDGGTTNFLSTLLFVAPFNDLHKRYEKNKKGSPVRRRLCFAMDILTRLVILALLLGIPIAVVWHILAPFPPFME